MSGCVEGWAWPHPAPPARHDRAALCVFPGRCWALNENMAYWWIIRIPILLASLVGGPQRPPEPFPGAGAGSRLGFGDGGREGWPRGGTGPWVPPFPPTVTPPDQPADLHADPQGDPGQAACQPEGLRRLQAAVSGAALASSPIPCLIK